MTLIPVVWIAAVCMMGGCSAVQKPAPIVEVKVPVTVPCITTAPAKPHVTTDDQLISLGDSCEAGNSGSCRDYVTLVHADRLALLAWKLEADAAIAGCVVR